MERDSDLFLEYGTGSEGSGETASPLRFPGPVLTSLEGFDVSSAECGAGGYHSLMSGSLWLGPPEERRRFVRALGSLLTLYRRRMAIPRQGPFLVCGVGNERASADSLGPRTAGKVFATDPALRDSGIPAVCAVRTGIPRETGIDTADLVSALAEKTKTALIVTVDSLCAKSGDRLGTVAQITDCGLIPGSALSHSSGEISRNTMPCPVLSVGVPTVVRASALHGTPDGSALPEGRREDAETGAGRPLFVTRADTDAMVSCYAVLIAQAINTAFTGNPPGDVMDLGNRA
ncbi:MAG: GPR endopeptidase [Ruminococcaceae bacterium]|jgi:spore protease|nr:GPR endopeptidase [Oscillospiraceae bacterium]